MSVTWDWVSRASHASMHRNSMLARGLRGVPMESTFRYKNSCFSSLRVTWSSIVRALRSWQLRRYQINLWNIISPKNQKGCSEWNTIKNSTRRQKGRNALESHNSSARAVESMKSESYRAKRVNFSRLFGRRTADEKVCLEKNRQWNDPGSQKTVLEES